MTDKILLNELCEGKSEDYKEGFVAALDLMKREIDHLRGKALNSEAEDYYGYHIALYQLDFIIKRILNE